MEMTPPPRGQARPRALPWGSRGRGRRHALQRRPGRHAVRPCLVVAPRRHGARWTRRWRRGGGGARVVILAFRTVIFGLNATGMLHINENGVRTHDTMAALVGGGGWASWAEPCGELLVCAGVRKAVRMSHHPVPTAAQPRGVSGLGL
jgi:hypothetical protein